jgi:hypothetical protein
MTAEETMAHPDLATLYQLCAGELDGALAVQARGHLCGCGVCQAELALARAFVDARDEPLPDSLQRRLRERFLEQVAQRLRAVATPHQPTAPATPKTPTAPAIPKTPAAPAARTVPAAYAAPATPAPAATSGVAPLRRARVRWRPLIGRRQAVGWLIAASVGAAALGVWQQLRDSTALLPSGQVRSLGMAPAWDLRIEALPEQGWRLRWEAVPQADRYAVRVLSISGTLLLERSASATGADIRPDELGTAPRGQHALVRVIARGPHGLRRETALRELPPLRASGAP